MTRIGFVLAGLVGVGVLSSQGGEIANSYVSVSTKQTDCLTKQKNQDGKDEFIAYCPPKSPDKVTFKVTALGDYELEAPTPNITPKKAGEMVINNTGKDDWKVKFVKGHEERYFDGKIIVKNVTLKPISVSFYTRIGSLTSDDRSVVYDAPHWTNGIAKTKPVAFVSGSNPKTENPQLSATFQVKETDIPPTLTGIRVRAKGAKAKPGAGGTVVYEEVTFIQPAGVTLREVKDKATGKVTLEADLNKQTFDTPIADVIKHYPDGSFILTWEMSTGTDENGNALWYPIGATPHTVYVTLEEPKTGLRQESLFYISCKAADGEYRMTHVPERVWSGCKGVGGFEGLDVRRVDGTQLTYYAKYDCNNLTTSELLAGVDGQCGAWVELFLDALKIQGFEFKKGNFFEICPSSNDHNPQVTSGPLDTGIMIKTWTFGTSSGKRPHPYQNTPVRASWFNATSTGYEWVVSPPAEVNYTEGTPGQGQGKNKPKSLFLRHYVAYVEVNGKGKYYDPSYGKIFDPNDPTIQPANLRSLQQQFMSEISGYYKKKNDFDARFREKQKKCEIQVKGIRKH